MDLPLLIGCLRVPTDSAMALQVSNIIGCRKPNDGKLLVCQTRGIGTHEAVFYYVWKLFLGGIRLMDVSVHILSVMFDELQQLTHHIHHEQPDVEHLEDLEDLGTEQGQYHVPELCVLHLECTL